MVESTTIQDAINFIRTYREDRASPTLVRYEIQIIYLNGDKVSAEFKVKADAIDFLAGYLPVDLVETAEGK